MRTNRHAPPWNAIVAFTILIFSALSLTMLSFLDGGWTVVSSKEAILKENLFTLRSVIDQYTLDKTKAPQSLNDVVTAGYLKQIPVDPCTGSRDTWVVERSDTLLKIDGTQPGINDVHSACEGRASDGTAYSSW